MSNATGNLIAQGVGQGNWLEYRPESNGNVITSSHGLDPSHASAEVIK